MSSGTQDIKRIRVGFLDPGSASWLGGAHYLRNLLYAISTLEEEREIEPYVFVGAKTDPDIVAEIQPYAKVIYSSVVNRRNRRIPLLWKYLLLAHLLSKHKIQVVSHSDVTGNFLPYKTLNWIPDFQHLHLTGFFSKKEISRRNKLFKKIIKESDAVVVSSHDALNDLNNFMPDCEINKKYVLNFVSQPKEFVLKSNTDIFRSIKKKYNCKCDFFYLPNQFWKHKNHQVVFDAVHLLKKEGVEILLLCSGLMHDHRNINHVLKLKKFISNHHLENNIKLLGLIDYEDVFILMRYSLAVINASLFEGWSSTVEEAKSMGKSVILSDIDVHKEQDPPSARYFNPGNAQELAEILKDFINNKNGGPDYSLETDARKALFIRTRKFALSYQKIIIDVL